MYTTIDHVLLNDEMELQQTEPYVFLRGFWPQFATKF